MFEWLFNRSELKEKEEMIEHFRDKWLEERSCSYKLERKIARMKGIIEEEYL